MMVFPEREIFMQHPPGRYQEIDKLRSPNVEALGSLAVANVIYGCSPAVQITTLPASSTSFLLVRHGQLATDE